MEAEELTNYDIVSYGFDDLEGLYLRGQWTVHRNDPPGINQVRHTLILTLTLTSLQAPIRYYSTAPSAASLVLPLLPPYHTPY